MTLRKMVINDQPLYVFNRSSEGEFAEATIRFIYCDHFLNSHDHSVSYTLGITGRNFVLITC